MIGKVISGSSFSGTVGYVMKEESRILEAEGVMPPEVKDMVQDFKDQTLLNPRLKNNVCLLYTSRVGDLLKMTQSNLIDGAIEYIPRKTKEGRPLTVRVPLNQTAKEIAARYKSLDGDKPVSYTHLNRRSWVTTFR